MSRSAKSFHPRRPSLLHAFAAIVLCAVGASAYGAEDCYFEANGVKIRLLSLVRTQMAP